MADGTVIVAIALGNKPKCFCMLEHGPQLPTATPMSSHAFVPLMYSPTVLSAQICNVKDLS